MKKERNLWRIVWITGIYAGLITILYLVVLYKVKWEDKDLSRYLYMYECGNSVCTTDNKIKEYNSVIKCLDDICPRILDIRGNIVILGDEQNNYLFDWRQSQTISDSYSTYRFASEDKTYIVTSKDDQLNTKYGVINIDGTLLVPLTDTVIEDYQSGHYTYTENTLTGIISATDEIKINADYEWLKLVNDSHFVFRHNNKYYIANYTTNKPINDNEYDYLYPYRSIILAIQKSKVYILNSDGGVLYDLKLDTYYPYDKDSERETLNIEELDDTLKFTIDNGDDTISIYLYSIKHNKVF